MKELKPLSIYDLMLGNIVYGISVDEETDQTSAYLCKIIGLDDIGWAEYPVMVEPIDDFNGYQYDWFEGVPLNHDRLIKLGWINYGTYFFDKDGFKFEYLALEKCFAFNINEKKLKLHFVHELQNLYKALKGENLKYSSP